MDIYFTLDYDMEVERVIMTQGGPCESDQSP